MKPTVILPFEDKPYALSYHNLAFPIGVIQACAKEDITPWLCEKFINPCFAPDSPSNKFAINFNDPWYRQDGILLVQTVELLPKSYSLLPYCRNEWMRRMLSFGWYVHGTFNEEYIPGKGGYQTYYFHHDYFIIGYDDDKQVFISVGYLKNRRFQRFEIPYENFEKALETVKAPKFLFGFVKLNPNAAFRLNHGRIAGELWDYLHSTSRVYPIVKGRYLGVDAIRQLKEYFADGHFDYRYTRGLMEHKFFMRMRMEYLWKNGFLTDEKFCTNANRVYSLAEKVHMLCLKCWMVQQESAKNALVATMDSIIQTELEYLPEAATCLQSLCEKERMI